MANPSVTYSFVNGQTSDGPQVSQNFTDLINSLTDGTKTLTVAAVSTGTLATTGNTTIGNATSDTLTITASVVAPILLGNGTSSAPAFGFSAAATEGIYRASSANLGAVANSASSFQFFLENMGVGSTQLSIFTQAGSSADSFIQMAENSGTSWAIGRDDSASNSFKVSRSTALGTNDALEIDTSNRTAISGAVNTSSVLSIGATNPLSSTTQIGVNLGSFVATSAATSAVHGYSAGVGTAAASFTASVLSHYRSVGTAKGAGSTVTHAVGFYSQTAMTTVGATNSAEFSNSAGFSGNYFIYQTGSLLSEFNGIVYAAAGVRTKVSTANVTTPTDAELDSAFGAPATVGAGFIGIVNDNNGGTDEYLCWSDGTNWFYATGTKAT